LRVVISRVKIYENLFRERRFNKGVRLATLVEIFCASFIAH